MLEEIRIENLGVIASARLSLGAGLTVITGETGAGKTMVLTGLGLLLGAKVDVAIVRTGASTAAVEGRVMVAADSSVASRAQDAGGELDDDGSLLLVRTVTAGRSRAFVGGRSVPQSVLGEIADELVTVHGQADQARLRSPARQREAIDSFAGPEHLERLAAYRAAWAQQAKLRAELDVLVERTHEDAREAELLRLGLAEIEQADPQPGEDVELKTLAQRLGHAEDLRAAVASAHLALVGDEAAYDGPSAVGAIDLARRTLEQAGENDPVLASLAVRTAEAGYLVADVATELSGYLQDVRADPARLQEVQTRRAVLGHLTRSFGTDIAEVLGWAQTAGRRLLDLDGGSGRIAELEKALAEIRTRLDELSARLGSGREQAASGLAQAVTAELAGLAMGGASLEVHVEPDEPGPWGAQSVEMLLVAHAGAPARPLGKGASGGELSRVMLAIEVSLATAADSGAVAPATFVFDEVDAGVGGKAATEVGRRLAMLARGAQVVVVTHLAQVAAFADRHLVVSKQSGSGIDAVTESDVRLVTGADRVRELARMLSGQEDSEAARTHAAELLERSGVGR